MKSITFGFGYLLVVLVVDVSSSNNYFFNVPKTTLNSPYNFVYYKKSDSLILEITLKNIPKSVTTVTASHFTFSYRYSNSKLMKDTFEVNVDKNTGEGKSIILTQLSQDQIWVDVELYNGEGLCNVTRITEGRYKILNYAVGFYWNTIQSGPLSYYYSDWNHDDKGGCFAPKACEIILDLQDTCKEHSKPTYADNFYCYLYESQYICKLERTATNFQDLIFSQTYADNSVIGPKLEIKQQKAKLSIKLELFDIGTSVRLESTRLRTNKTIWSDTRSITAQDISKASNVTILKYTDTTDVQFSCEQYKSGSTKIHVGFINTTDNKITTHNTTIMKRKKFMMADNGTILCCIVYVSNKDWQKITITRMVKNKTLLMYQLQEATSTKKTEPCQFRWWLYVFPTLFGTAILSPLLTIYIVKKQRCYTNSQPAEETMELDNYATTNQVLYANLDFVHNESRPANQTEESPYANVIGVLHPL